MKKILTLEGFQTLRGLFVKKNLQPIPKKPKTKNPINSNDNKRNF